MSDSISKAKINKTGESIRNCLLNNQIVSNEDLSNLQLYRTSFKDPLNKANEELNRIMKKIDKSGVITYRVKRIESIFSKLIRFEKMDLARMHDIAGARCIVLNEKKVRAFVNEIQKSQILEVKDVDDYITNPKETGYKSIHLRCVCEGKFIEVQVRDETQHSWATLVEITDVIYKTKIKENRDDKNTGLYEFLQLFSKSKNLTLEERKKINEVLFKTKFIQRVTNTFCKNAIILRNNWCKKKIPKGQFYVFEVDKKNNPNISVYDNFIKAEEKYFSSFTKDMDIQETNYVMAYISNDDFEMISKAYSNYVLIKHNFYMNLSNILRNDSSDKKTNSDSFALLDLCNNCQTYVHVSELNMLVKMIPSKNKKYEEWMNYIHKEVYNTSKLPSVKYETYKVPKKFNFYTFKTVVKISFLIFKIKKLSKKIKK